ncbi:MAG: type IV secretion system protein [Neisseriaceae bacterium]|nr:type IV secretion system protein [Neisseriaceae bacterium]
MSEKKSLNKEAHKYIQSAKDFEQSEIDRVRKNAKTAWRLSFALMGITALAVGAVVMLTPLKTVQPFVIRVDNNTGLTDTVSVMKNRQDRYEEIVDKYFLKQYVQYREAYDWETIQTTFDATKLMSSPPVANEFAAMYAGETAPHKVLKNSRKVLVKVQSVAFLGNLAQVRFTKQAVEVNGDMDNQKTEPLKMIATIAWEYQGGKMSEQDRLINPLGFKVLSYRVDREQ